MLWPGALLVAHSCSQHLERGARPVRRPIRLRQYPPGAQAATATDRTSLCVRIERSLDDDVLALRQLLREVASAEVTAVHLEHRVLLRADVLRQPAPGAEAAAGGRVGRARRVALQDDLSPLAAESRIRHRYGGQQG